MILPWIDIDIDSKNELMPGVVPAATEEDDRYELTDAKYVVTDYRDVDGDGILDYADLDGVEGAHFTPVVISLSENLGQVYDLDSVLIQINWGLPQLPVMDAYGRPSHSMAWLKDAPYPRTLEHDTLDGAYQLIPGWTRRSYTLSELNLRPGGKITLWADALWSETLSVELMGYPRGAPLPGDLHYADDSYNMNRWYYSTERRLTDSVKVRAAPMYAAMDNDRDGIIMPNRKQFPNDALPDETTREKPFLFWTNDNREGWGEDEYPAAVDLNRAVNDPDSADDRLGFDIDSLAPAAAQEVKRRDLEDFAPLSLQWYEELEEIATGIEFAFEPATGSNAAIRLFPSARGPDVESPHTHSPWWSDASSHVDDPATIELILDRTDRIAGSLLTHGHSLTLPFARSAPGQTIVSDMGVRQPTNGSTQHIMHMMQVMFEGVTPGDGELVVKLVKDDVVLQSTRVYLSLHSIKDFYDHYTVAYGSNVQGDGTYASYTNPLDLLQPVQTIAQLQSENAVRDRQEDDYLLFVHGWRMKEWERLAFAESTFKRMYWSGYKGQFGLFSWPTEATDSPTNDTGNFDRSEFIAWNSAAALKNTLRTIRSTHAAEGNLSVMAHSMGNIVAGDEYVPVPPADARGLPQRHDSRMLSISMIPQAIAGVLLGLTSSIVLAQPTTREIAATQTSAATQLVTSQPEKVDEKTVTGGGELFPDATPANVLLVTQKVFPAVVRIDVAQEVYEGGKKTTRRGIGSGTIFDKEGHILTNYHVAGRGVEFFVTLANKERVKARLVGDDHWTDLAVIQMDLDEIKQKGFEFTHAMLGTSENLTPGQDVIAIGTPFGLARTLTLGVVSNTERTFYPEKQSIDNYETGEFSNWIQMDTPIAQGSSGGPLVDLSAKVVGVNTRGFQGQSLNFAIPIDTAKRVVEEILASAAEGKKGRVTRGYLGVDFRPLQDLEAAFGVDINKGALVSTVDKNSPAGKAGLKTGDVILSINDQPTNIRFPEEIAVVRNRIASLGIGSDATIVFQRHGQAEQTVVAKVEKLESKVGDERELKAWGMSVQDVTRILALERRLDDDKGVMVTSVTPGFAAAKAEVYPGDVIRRVDGQEIEDLDALSTAYDAAVKADAKQVLLDIQRGRGVQSVVLKLDGGK